jgi:hypothetical protein
MSDTTVAVTAEELEEMACPRCGRPMDHGYVAGHWFNLRWVETKRTKTMFSGEKLRQRFDSIFYAPNVEAARCGYCKLGVFRYDY